MLNTNKVIQTQLTSISNKKLQLISFHYRTFVKDNQASLAQQLINNLNNNSGLFIALNAQGEVKLATYQELKNLYAYCDTYRFINSATGIYDTTHKLLKRYRNWLAKNYLYAKLSLRHYLRYLMGDFNVMESHYLFTPNAYAQWIVPQIANNKDNDIFINHEIDRNYLLRAQEEFAKQMTILPNLSECMKNEEVALLTIYVLQYGKDAHLHSANSTFLLNLANKTLL